MVLWSEADFRRQMKEGLSGGYLFFGEEDYTKASMVRSVREAVLGDGDVSGQCFNDVRLGGMDFTVSGFLDALTALPFGSDRKIITVSGLNFNDMRASDLEALCRALEQIPDYPECVVVISAAADALEVGTLPKRPSALLTTLGEYLQPVNFERIAPARLAGWVQKHFQHDGVQASPEVCAFVVSWCGRNMHQLASEVQKVAFYVLANGRDTVTEADVRTAAVSAMEYDAFAFANAVMEWRREEALAILQDLKFRRVEPLFILSEVSRTMCDLLSVSALVSQGCTPAEIAGHLHMHEYKAKLYAGRVRTLDPARLRGAVEACDAADKAMKLSPKGYDILERLICSI